MQFLGKERFQLNETRKETNSAANKVMKFSYNFYNIIKRNKVYQNDTACKCIKFQDRKRFQIMKIRWNKITLYFFSGNKNFSKCCSRDLFSCAFPLTKSVFINIGFSIPIKLKWKVDSQNEILGFQTTQLFLLIVFLKSFEEFDGKNLSFFQEKVLRKLLKNLLGKYWDQLNWSLDHRRIWFYFW